MKKIFFILVLTLLVGCTQDCEVFDEDGFCCTEVCDIECEEYVEGTCNCECVSDSKVADMFVEDDTVQPPSLS